jgi:hypothetical protein
MLSASLKLKCSRREGRRGEREEGEGREEEGRSVSVGQFLAA